MPRRFSRFQEVDEDDEVESCRAQSAPGRVDCDTPRSMLSEDLRLSGDASTMTDDGFSSFLIHDAFMIVWVSCSKIQWLCVHDHRLSYDGQTLLLRWLSILWWQIQNMIWLFTIFKRIHKGEHDEDWVCANTSHALQTDKRKRRNPWKCISPALWAPCWLFQYILVCFICIGGDPVLVRQQLQQHVDRAANAWYLGSSVLVGSRRISIQYAIPRIWIDINGFLYLNYQKTWKSKRASVDVYGRW